MDTITDLLKVECVCSRRFGATCPAHRRDFMKIFGYGCINQNENHGNPLNFNHTLAPQCQSVLRTTTQVNGKVGNSTAAPSKTTEPIVT